MHEVVTLDPGAHEPMEGLLVKNPFNVHIGCRDMEDGKKYWDAITPALHVSKVHGDSKEDVLRRMLLRIGSDFESAEERDRCQISLSAHLEIQRSALYEHISRVA